MKQRYTITILADPEKLIETSILHEDEPIEDHIRCIIERSIVNDYLYKEAGIEIEGVKKLKLAKPRKEYTGEPEERPVKVYWCKCKESIVAVTDPDNMDHSTKIEYTKAGKEGRKVETMPLREFKTKPFMSCKCFDEIIKRKKESGFSTIQGHKQFIPEGFRSLEAKVNGVNWNED